jgi:hypothetical protein
MELIDNRFTAPASTAGIQGRMSVELRGGPFDRQDILVSKDEYASGTFLRNSQRYVASDPPETTWVGASLVRVFHWIDSDAFRVAMRSTRILSKHPRQLSWKMHQSAAGLPSR